MLREVGYDEETVARVGSLLRKEGLKRDPEVQSFEVATKHREDKMIDIIQRTWRKMSERGHRSALALAATLPAEGCGLLERALAPIS